MRPVVLTLLLILSIASCVRAHEMRPVPMSSHPDLPALMALYQATDGANWTDNTGWAAGAAGTNCTPCDGTWFGITCVNDRVTRLNMQGNNLVGTLPDELGDLSEIELLTISINSDLTGPIPTSIFSLPNLRLLSLRDNDLSGGIPTAIGLATNLRNLILDNNDKIGGTIPLEIVNLMNLTQLSLGFCGLTGGLTEEIGQMTELRNIVLSINDLSGPLPASLSQLSNLTELRLRRNNFSGCYPNSYSGTVCNVNTVDFSLNGGLPDGGSAAGFTDFCQTGTGGCTQLCPTDDLVINSAADVNDFVASFPDCVDLPGNLVVDGAGIPSNNGLSQLTSIGGDVTLRNLSTNGFGAVANIVTVGGNVLVEDCPNYGGTPVAGVFAVEQIGGNLVYNNLPVLQSLAPLANLTSIGGELQIVDLPNLGSLQGFQNLTAIGTGSGATANGLVRIDNTAISNLNQLGGVNSDLLGLVLRNNPSLADVSGVGGTSRSATIMNLQNLEISNNDALADLTGLENLQITDEVTAEGNASLTECAIESFCNALADPFVNAVFGNNAVGGNCNTNAEVAAACQALPVDWISFEARLVGKVAELTWATSAEEHNLGFEVERSADGGAWTKIGEVLSTERPIEVNSYSFSDRNPLNGDNFYRLRQRDYDGQFSFSEVRQLSVGSEEGVFAYPNPFDEQVTLYSSSPTVLEIFDARGQLIQREAHLGGGAQVQEIGWKSGVYCVRFVATGEVVRVIRR